MPDLFETLANWRERLNATRSLPESETLEQGVDTLLRWNARRVVAEQMVVLETARLMEAHKLTIGDLYSYLCSSDAKRKPLGRLGIATGLTSIIRRVGTVFLPLLRQGAYRPYLQHEVASALLALQKIPGVPPQAFDLGRAADVIYAEGLSPFAAAQMLKRIRKLTNARPEALPQLLESLGLARYEASSDIANLEEVDGIVEAIEPGE